MPLGPARGIILHYLQTTLNQSFDLPLLPLNGATCGDGSPGSQGSGPVALVAASSGGT